MKTLFLAIYDYYSTSSLAEQLTDLYNTEAPSTAVFPYGVFSLPSNVRDGTFTEDFEDCLIQFSLYSDESSASKVCDCFELLKTIFDHVDLTVSGYSPISCEREPANLVKVDGVWQYTVTYRIVLQKNN